MLSGEGDPGEEEGEQESAPDPPSKPKRARKKTRTHSPSRGHQESGAQGGPEVKLLERPHKSTWFLPGRVGKVPVQILMDTGCTTNLMSKAVFDRLDKATRKSVEPCEAFGTLADGKKIKFHGMIKTNLKIRHYGAEETFVIGQSDEDIILGMSFFIKNDCTLDFKRGTLELQGKQLVCTDRNGHPLMYKVQVYKGVELPPGEEVTVAGRVPVEAAQFQGIVEGYGEKVLVAASLNQPDSKGRILLWCLNLSGQPVKLAAGAVVGEWHRIEEKDVQDLDTWTTEQQEPRDPGPRCEDLDKESEQLRHSGECLGNSYGLGPRCEVLGKESEQLRHAGECLRNS